MVPEPVFAQLNPFVCNVDAPMPSVLELRFGVGVPSVEVFFPALKVTKTLKPTPNSSGKVFTTSVPAEAFLTGYSDTDVHRVLVCDIKVQADGETIQVRVYGDVLTADVPPVSVKTLASDVQFSDNLVNIQFPALADAQSKIEPQVNAICKKFYSHFGDDYDFLQIVIARCGYTERHHFATRIDAQGIGAVPLTHGAPQQFFSDGRLLGISMFPDAIAFDGANPTALHELGHQWLNGLKYPLMKNAGFHWPISDLMTDLMGLTGPDALAGVPFYFTLKKADGSEIYDMVANNAPKGYSDLGLYLMGLLPWKQVADHFVFNDQKQKPKNFTLLGPVTVVKATHIIDHEGERKPDWLHSQKRFRVATILVTKHALARPETMRLYDFFAKRAGATEMLDYHDGIKGQCMPFKLATRGVGRLDPRIKQRILIDASRDGGLWWAPQAASFKITKPHQGKKLADHLRALGHKVKELPRPTTITPALLADFDIVIRVGGFTGYSPAEIEAYNAWVKDFGSLLLLADHHPHDGLASHFGLEFRSIVRGNEKLSAFKPHAITKGVTTLAYLAGSGLTAHPPNATVLGKLSTGSFLDLNDNQKKNANEPVAPAALGVMPFGEGSIVFCGDANLWEKVPQPLVRNTLRWFASSLRD
jgi:hypothetical protein